MTQNRYFNGCEASNIIFLTYGALGVRNSLLRAVKNIICVNVGGRAEIEGMKEDNRFYWTWNETESEIIRPNKYIHSFDKR